MEPNLIIRKPELKSYVIVGMDCINDPAITYEAKGFLVYLLSRPENWNVNKWGLSQKNKTSEWQIKKIVNELIENSYLFRIQKRKGGRISSWGFVVTPIRTTKDEIRIFLKNNNSDWVLYKEKQPFLDGELLQVELQQVEKLQVEIQPTYIIKKRANMELRKKGPLSPCLSKERHNANADGIRRKLREGQLKQQEKQKDLAKEKETAFVDKVFKKKNVKELFELWYSSVMVLKKNHYTETKNFKKAVKLINKAVRGTLFTEEYGQDEWIKGLVNEKISLQHIKECIELHIKALSINYYPADKKTLKMHLDQFLLNPYAIIKSRLAYWTYNEPVIIGKQKNTEHKDVAKVLFKKMNLKEENIRDRNVVIDFLNRNMDFIKEQKLNPVFFVKNKAEVYAEIIIDCFRKQSFNEGSFEITPSLFSHKYADLWLKKYIKESRFTI